MWKINWKFKWSLEFIFIEKRKGNLRERKMGKIEKENIGGGKEVWSCDY